MKETGDITVTLLCIVHCLGQLFVLSPKVRICQDYISHHGYFVSHKLVTCVSKVSYQDSGILSRLCIKLGLLRVTIQARLGLHCSTIRLWLRLRLGLR